MENVLTVEQIDEALYILKMFANTRPEFRTCIKEGMSHDRVASKRKVRMPYTGMRMSVDDIREMRGALKREKMRIINQENNNTMDQNILKQVGITEEEFNNLKESWQKDRPKMDAKYLQSPEGKLLDAIYGKY